MDRLRDRKVLLILFFWSLFIRLIFVLALENRFYFPDEYEYYRMIENFISGRGLILYDNMRAFRPPLYAFFASLFYMARIGMPGLRIAQAIISSLTVCLVYMTGTRVFPGKTGLVAGAISSIYPFFIFYNGFLLTETLFIFLLSASIYCLVNLGRSAWIPAKAGILLGLSGLARPTVQAYMPLALLLILFSGPGLAGNMKKASCVLIFFLLTLTPWVARNYLLLDRFVPGTTMGGYVFWEGNNPHSDGGPCEEFPDNIFLMDETERDDFLYARTLEVIRDNPARFRWLLVNKFRRFWNVVPNASEFDSLFYRAVSVSSFGLLMPFFILGFFISLPVRRARFMHLLIIFFTASHMLFLASIRYRVPIEPFYIIFSAYGFLWLVNRISDIIKGKSLA